MKIGNNIRKIRESRNISIDQVIKAIKIFKENYIRIENNSVKPTADILRKIARFFNLSEKDIINYNLEDENIDKLNVQKLELKNLTFKSERLEIENKFTVGKLISLKPQLLNNFELNLIKSKPNITGVSNIKPSDSIEILDDSDIEDELDDIDPLEGLDFKRGTTFSPRLLNYIEPYFINGFRKTLFYTEVNSGLKVGDRVFILNGNYDSNSLIKENKYKIGTDGYKVLFIDKCRIVLDIDFTGVLPFNNDDIDQFINVYYVKNREDFIYVNKQFTTRGNNYDYKFNQFQNNIIYVDNNDNVYGVINNSDWGETLGLTGSPGFFVKNGTASWVNITQDFINGSYSVALSPTYSNNDTVKINWGTFTYSIGNEVVEFKDGFSYKWSLDSKFDLFNGTYSTWEVDSKYLQPIITKGNFRGGNFKGNFNSGVFGSTDQKIEWNNAIFNSGTVFNTKWINGEINSIYTLKESYVSDFNSNGLPFQRFVSPNNNGRGYNFIINSDLDSSVINNANVYNTNIGELPNFSTVENHILEISTTYSNVVNNGLLENVNVIGSLINEADVKNSRVSESKLENIRSINSNYKSSVIKESTYISEDSIKILDYDEYNFSISNAITHKLYRFYITRDAYERLKVRDVFYIKGLKINDGTKYPLNFFDKKFRFSSWVEYIDDYNSIDNNFYKRGYETAAFLSTPEENSFDFNSFDNSGVFSTETIQPNQKKGYSIDIVVSVNDINGTLIGNNQYNEISPLGLNFNRGLIPGIPQNLGNNIDISIAYILDSDFESGLFESSDWESGYHINYNNDVNITRTDSPIDNIGGFYDIEISGTNSLLINTLYTESDKESSELCLSEGNIVYLNNVDYISSTGSIVTLGDTYKILNNDFQSTGQLTLEEIGTNIIQTLATGGSYSTIGAENRWGYLYKTKFDNSKIRSGLFRRPYIKGSFIESEDYDLTDIEFTGTRRLKRLAISDSIFKNNENIFSSAIYLNSSFVNGSDQFKNGIVYKSIWNGLTFSNGVFKESRWIDGVFEGGLFYNNRSFNGNPNSDYPFYSNDRIKSYYKSGETSANISNNRYSWQNGEFNGGEFYKSDWEDGDFNGGEFYFSKFYDGIINGGIIGDNSIQTENTIIYNGEINFTNVDNAVLFSSNNFSGISSSTINWYDGVFNKGSFGSSVQPGTFSATWYDGIFNGGDFISMAKWKSGTFNGGKFISGFGWTMSDSNDLVDYSWEDGIFNGGNFGNANGLTNSTWYKGQFNGGVFTGRVWNDGIFTNGEFEGSAATYSAIGGVTSSNANEFVLSFTNSYFGVWRNGFFTIEKDRFIKDKKIFTDKKSLKLLKKNEKSTIKNTIWLGGTFSHSDGEMVNCVWLDGAFERGKFIESSFNPYVVTDHLIMNNRVTSIQPSFNVNDSTCHWYNGKLEISDFYYSIWEKGTYTIGDSYGMIWKNGVCEYMNAFNICWQDGLWRNGNWYGSYFNFNGTLSDPFTIEILNRTADCTGTQSLHIWNIFEDSSDDLNILSVTSSMPNPQIIINSNNSNVNL